MSPQRERGSSPALLPLLVLSLQLLSPPGIVAVLAAGNGNAPPPSKPIVTPIAKDPATNLYTINIKKGAPLVLDLAGPLVWSNCQPSQAAVPCEVNVCKVASRSHPAGCVLPQPGSPNGRCTCTAYPYNPATGQCAVGTFAGVPLTADATDGKSPLFPVSFDAYEACAPSGFQWSLPKGAAGVAGLSRQPLSLPSQVADKLKVPRQFALCLPASGQTGAAIFGGGPFQLQSSHPEDLADQLRKNPLPLVRNPKNGAYYFRVHGIAVNQARVPVAPGALDLDARRGTGGVAFSSATPYTTVRPDILSALVKAFGAATSGIPRRPNPASPPFRICYEASAFAATRLGPGVANIDLMLDGGRNWTIFGANSLMQVDSRTLCLAFVEMGAEAAVPESPAVILGGYQMENNLVLFDLEKETFGFSSLLFGRQTTCGNFNFAKRSA